MLHTATGSLVCREPNEALQMLFLTMAHQSTAVGTRPLDAVDEHFIGRYRVGPLPRLTLRCRVHCCEFQV